MKQPKTITRAKQIVVATLAAGTIAVGGLTYHLAADYAAKKETAAVATGTDSPQAETSSPTTEATPEVETSGQASPEETQTTSSPTASRVAPGTSDDTQSNTRGS